MDKNSHKNGEKTKKVSKFCKSENLHLTFLPITIANLKYM